MDFSSANIALWAPIIQMGIIAMLILVANVLRRKIAFIRNSLMPTAVLAGFLMLILRNIGFEVIDDPRVLATHTLFQRSLFCSARRVYVFLPL